MARRDKEEREEMLRVAKQDKEEMLRVVKRDKKKREEDRARAIEYVRKLNEERKLLFMSMLRQLTASCCPLN